MAINLAAYVLSTKANVITQTREIDVVLPFSAALAGRLLAGRLLAGRLKAAKLVPLLLVVLLGYLLGLAGEISQPPVAAQNQQLTSWLVARHLHTGLSGYWESNVVTLTSGDQVQIRLVARVRRTARPQHLRVRKRSGTTRTGIRPTSSCSSPVWPGIPASPRSRPCWRRSASPREPTTSVPTRSWSGIRICYANSAKNIMN